MVELVFDFRSEVIRLIAVHHWGWTLRLNPDATTTTTATSPDGQRVWHSHGPPGQAA